MEIGVDLSTWNTDYRHMTHEEYIKVNIEQAYAAVRSGEWTVEVFAEWYAANVMEAEADAVYYQNL